MKSIYLVPIFFLFIQWPCFSKVIENKAIGLSIQSYTFREVCKSMGVENNLLESAVGLTHIDCTSRKVRVLDFCKKRSSSKKSLIRGRIDSLEGKSAICEYAESVVLKIKCTNKMINCQRVKESCEKLRPLFAYELNLHHSSKKENALSCFYTTDKELDL